ncbi:hypothetical protein FKM82_012975 [Ascaphus truei]
MLPVSGLLGAPFYIKREKLHPVQFSPSLMLRRILPSCPAQVRPSPFCPTVGGIERLCMPTPPKINPFTEGRACNTLPFSVLPSPRLVKGLIYTFEITHGT